MISTEKKCDTGALNSRRSYEPVYPDSIISFDETTKIGDQLDSSRYGSQE